MVSEHWLAGLAQCTACMDAAGYCACLSVPQVWEGMGVVATGRQMLGETDPVSFLNAHIYTAAILQCLYMFPQSPCLAHT